ncbi:hypothetical protein [Rhizobium mongolense]|uniref:hypothetical protein n=1 Tax=Rhizobium mongolense TaxID=57676 RepID=UPI0034A4E24C
MHIDYKERINELNTGLAPILEKLGLQAVLAKQDSDIEFVSHDRRFVSPLTVAVNTRKVDTDPSPGWRGSYAFLHGYHVFELGTNKWKHHRWIGISGKRYFSDLDDALAEIGEVLVGHPLVPQGEHENVTHNYDFARAFEEIDLYLDEDVTVLCERIDGIESYVFEGPDGCEWKLSFEEKDAVLYIDGIKISECPAAKPRLVGFLVCEEIAERGLEKPFGF